MSKTSGETNILSVYKRMLCAEPLPISRSLTAETATKLTFVDAGKGDDYVNRGPQQVLSV